MTKKPTPVKAPGSVTSTIMNMTQSNVGWFVLGLAIGILAGFLASWLISNLSISWTGVVT